MPIAPCRGRGSARESGTEIERIYISQHLSLSRPLQRIPPPPESQPWADERSKFSQLPSVSSLSLPRSHPHLLFLQHERNRSVTFLKVSLSLSLSLSHPPALISPAFPEKERSLQKGLRARRPLFRRRRSHRLRQQAGWPSSLPVRLRRCHHHR